MAKIKTTETSKSVTDFINSVSNEIKRNDSFQIIEIMQKITGFEPKMWGPTIIGFGKYHYKYDTGHEGDMPVAAFSPRSTAIVIYLAETFENRDELFQKLGKYKTGKVCLYIKKLGDIDVSVLKKMISNSIKNIQSRYPDKAKK
ncbi:MAG TPA: DUF1801 domain-containing protein [Chitinophagaceae bacterium]|nr:DUF1801 domain-containing protein [Chitinophagaceae bacterium]